MPTFHVLDRRRRQIDLARATTTTTTETTTTTTQQQQQRRCRISFVTGKIRGIVLGNYFDKPPEGLRAGVGAGILEILITFL